MYSVITSGLDRTSTSLGFLISSPELSKGAGKGVPPGPPPRDERPSATRGGGFLAKSAERRRAVEAPVPPPAEPTAEPVGPYDGANEQITSNHQEWQIKFWILNFEEFLYSEELEKWFNMSISFWISKCILIHPRTSSLWLWRNR